MMGQAYCSRSGGRWDPDISETREYGEAQSLSLGRFVFSLFFCNHAFIVFRYKKPHAALARERTKPVNQKHKERKVTAPVNMY